MDKVPLFPSRLNDADLSFWDIFRAGLPTTEYCDLERNYKLRAHERWDAELNRTTFRKLIKTGDYKKIAAIAVAIESKTNLLFSFEKMALRDAVKTAAGARSFAVGLMNFCMVVTRSKRGLRHGVKSWLACLENKRGF